MSGKQRVNDKSKTRIRMDMGYHTKKGRPRASFCLPSFVHLFVVFLVLAGGDIVEPGLVVEVPTDGQ